MKSSSRFALVALGATCAWALAGSADAAIIFTGSSGSGDTAVNAEADFTFSAGHLELTLTNLLGASVIKSIGQAISDISFTLSNAPGILGTTSASGQQGEVDKTNFSVTYDTSGSPGRFLGIGGGTPIDISGNTITLEALGGGQPTELILPFVANGGAYTNGNASFNSHNSNTIGPATFELNLSGVTANTTVTAATFSFGTQLGEETATGTCTQNCTPTTVPEPASLALFGTALAGLGLLWRRRRKV